MLSVLFPFGVLGLVVPGYVLARALRVPFSIAAAFPLSALLLVESVIVCTLLGAPINLWTISPPMVAVTVIGAALLIRERQNPRATADTETKAKPGKASIAVWVQVALLLIGLTIRVTAVPLRGPDTPFRWDGLARLMLSEQGLSHYPPLTAEDFSSYFFPDAIPPLVSTVYWWLYACWGAPLPALTSVSIALQALACLLLVYSGARATFGTSGGTVALVALSSSMLFVRGVAIGQDTGFTAISMAGQLAYAFAARAAPARQNAVMAGLFAALGALTREYGVLLSVVGFVVLAIEPKTRRLLPLFVLTVTLVAGPWYLRTWVRTGNPLYPFDMLGLGFPTNEVHVGLHDMYREQAGIRLAAAGGWARVALNIAVGGPVALALGLLGVLLCGRARIGIIAAIAVGLTVWLWAIPYTLGGPLLSLRMFTSVFVALSFAAGACGPAIERLATARPPRIGIAELLPIGICALVATLDAWSYPLEPTRLIEAQFNRVDDPMGWRRQATQVLERTGIPDVGVLTDDVFLAVALHGSGGRSVMAWSPAVSFVFDRRLDAAEVRRRLREQQIMFVCTYPENDPYLERFPFYKADAIHWRKARVDGHPLEMYLLPP